MVESSEKMRSPLVYTTGGKRGKFARRFINSKPKDEEERKVQGWMKEFCRAVVEEDWDGVKCILDRFNERRAYGMVWSERMVLDLDQSGEPWIDIENTTGQETRVDLAIEDFVVCITSQSVREAVGYLKDMITIKELMERSSLGESALRERIRVARLRGELKWYKVGNVVLLDREEGLKLALEEQKRGRPKKAVNVG